MKHLITIFFFVLFFFGFTAFTNANTTLVGESLAINITSPNGGETLRIGQSYPIFWSSTPDIDMVSVAYKLSSGVMGWIAYNVPNDNVLVWKNINVGSSVAQVKIWIIGYKTGYGSVTDESNNYFTVTSPIPALSVQVLSPNGGETLRIGQSYPITWSTSPTIDKVSIAYKLSSGTMGWIANNIPNSKVFVWKNINIGNSMPSTQVKIWMIGYQTGFGSVTDESNNFFTVSPTFARPIPTLTPCTYVCEKFSVCRYICLDNSI